MKNHKQIIASVLVIVFSTQLCGFSLSKPSVVIDTEKDHVYKYVSLDTVNKDFETDSKKAASKYDKNYYLVTGTIKSMKDNGSSFVLAGSEGEAECSCEKSVRANVLKYINFVNDVAVFGKMNVDPFDKERHIEVEKVIAAPSAIKSRETYFTIDGSSFDYSGAFKRTLASGRVTYYIPSKWKEIEHNIIEEDMGTLEGYEYVLNKTPGESKPEPEYLFICYFDKKLLKEPNDINDIEAVEKAIIKNIDGDVGSFPQKEQKTYYGANYKYYVGSFKDALDGGKGYRTEYVFLEDKGKGTVLFLYVYKDAKYSSDVMFATRFLEIAE